MTHPNLDELDRVRFAWPEPLVIELICDEYCGLIPPARRLPIAKLHQQFLRSLVEDEADRAALRQELTAQFAACDLATDLVAKIERAVFFELIRIVGVRFRNSPRLREAYGRRLQAAIADISSALEPKSAPRTLLRQRPPIIRWKVRAAAAN